MIQKIAIITVAALLAACGSADTGAGDTSNQQVAAADSDSVAAAPSIPTPASVTDPQIAAIVLAANNVDVNAGELALQKASDPEVKAFAQQMVSDHNALNQQANELMSRLGATAEENATSDALTQAGADNVAKLQMLQGEAFDKAYIDHEVAYHQQVIDMLDNVLIPNAQDPELNALVAQARPVFAQHLEDARQIQTRLNL